MNPHLRYLSATLALVAVATAYFVLQGRGERPAPRLPTPVMSAARPTAMPAGPPTARDILDRDVVLDLDGEQRLRLEALDSVWTREVSGLETAIHESEREFTGFMKEAQGSRGVSTQEIQRRSAEFSQLSAELRERRQQHSEAALRVLADWQRQRLMQSRPPVIEGRTNGRN
jgi:hypothetical protein